MRYLLIALGVSEVGLGPIVHTQMIEQTEAHQTLIVVV